MADDARARLAELSSRTWTTGEEYEALNREYDAVLAELGQSFAADANKIATRAVHNHQERQSLKRKAERWADNLRAMPAIEQAAILAALAAALTEKE